MAIKATTRMTMKMILKTLQTPDDCSSSVCSERRDTEVESCLNQSWPKWFQSTSLGSSRRGAWLDQGGIDLFVLFKDGDWIRILVRRGLNDLTETNLSFRFQLVDSDRDDIVVICDKIEKTSNTNSLA